MTHPVRSEVPLPPAVRRARARRVIFAGATLAMATVVTACVAEMRTSLQPIGNLDRRSTELDHDACDITSSSAVKVDVNGDNRPDIIHVMKGGKEVCRAVDLNFDGAMDVFIYYDSQGRERRMEADFDRDGRPDEITHYQDGQVVMKERETNFDNKIDTWDHYEGGRLVRRERDTDGDGIVDQWWEFNNPTNAKCAVVATDRDGDGKPDPDSVVDLCSDSYAGNGTVPGKPAGDAGAPGADGGPPPPAPAATNPFGAMAAPPDPVPPVASARPAAPASSAPTPPAPATSARSATPDSKSPSAPSGSTPSAAASAVPTSPKPQK